MQRVPSYDIRGIIILGSCVLVILIFLFLHLWKSNRNKSKKKVSMTLPVLALLSAILSIALPVILVFIKGIRPLFFSAPFLRIYAFPVSMILCTVICFIGRKTGGILLYAAICSFGLSVYLFFANSLPLLFFSDHHANRLDSLTATGVWFVCLSVILMTIYLCQRYHRYAKSVVSVPEPKRKILIPVIGYILLSVSAGALVWLIYIGRGIYIEMRLLAITTLLANGLFIATGSLPLCVFPIIMLISVFTTSPYMFFIQARNYYLFSFSDVFLVCNVIITLGLIIEQMIRLYYHPQQRYRKSHTNYSYLEQYRSQMYRK